MRLLFCVLLATGCGGPVDEEYGWQPLHGERHVTVKNGLTFYWTGPYGRYTSAAQVSLELDEVFIDWLELYEVQHGYQVSRQLRTQAMQGIAIQLFADYKVPGPSDKVEYGVYWPWEHQIDTAMGTPYHWDAYLGIHTEGLEQLKHEWTHVLAGGH